MQGKICILINTNERGEIRQVSHTRERKEVMPMRGRPLCKKSQTLNGAKNVCVFITHKRKLNVYHYILMMHIYIIYKTMGLNDNLCAKV
jgi:hypothetical protein